MLRRLKRWFNYRVQLGHVKRAYLDSIAAVALEAKKHGLKIKDLKVVCDYCEDDCGQCGNGGHIWRLNVLLNSAKDRYHYEVIRLRRGD